MKKRLIDANEPINAFKRYAKNHPNATWNAFGIEEVINAANTVDAVEVVHGRWRKTYTCHGERLWGYECDQCKADSPNASNYCPNCGAKMGGDGNG